MLTSIFKFKRHVFSKKTDIPKGIELQKTALPFKMLPQNKEFSNKLLNEKNIGFNYY